MKCCTSFLAVMAIALVVGAPPTQAATGKLIAICDQFIEIRDDRGQDSVFVITSETLLGTKEIPMKPGEFRAGNLVVVTPGPDFNGKPTAKQVNAVLKGALSSNEYKCPEQLSDKIGQVHEVNEDFIVIKTIKGKMCKYSMNGETILCDGPMRLKLLEFKLGTWVKITTEKDDQQEAPNATQVERYVRHMPGKAKKTPLEEAKASPKK